MHFMSLTGSRTAFRLPTLSSLLATLPSAAAPHYAPAVSVSPSSGPPGTPVTVNGSGFVAGFNAGIRRDGATPDPFTMPGSGSFPGSISVPGGDGAGGHTISACNYCGGGGLVLVLRRRGAAQVS